MSKGKGGAGDTGIYVGVSIVYCSYTLLNSRFYVIMGDALFNPF